MSSAENNFFLFKMVIPPRTVKPLIAVTTSHVHGNPAASVSPVVCHGLGDNHPVTDVFSFF
jgi:hypothetical protein